MFERGVVTVMCNLGSEKVELPYSRRPPLLLASKAEVVVKGGSVELPADSVAILSGETIR
jgi:maltooligosyltrehalose trehalohydrolase